LYEVVHLGDGRWGIREEGTNNWVMEGDKPKLFSEGAARAEAARLTQARAGGPAPGPAAPNQGASDLLKDEAFQRRAMEPGTGCAETADALQAAAGGGLVQPLVARARACVVGASIL
jgi:hypothetical protein